VRESFTPNHPALFYDAAVEMIFHKFSGTGNGLRRIANLAREHSSYPSVRRNIGMGNRAGELNGRQMRMRRAARKAEGSRDY
jgi:hypothetical protein